MGAKSLGLRLAPVLLAIIWERGLAYGPEFSWPLSIAGLLPLSVSSDAVFLASKLKPPPVDIPKKTSDLIPAILVLVVAAVLLLAYYILATRPYSSGE